MPCYELSDLTLARPGGFRLGPLSARIDAGARSALIGPSGCGKTTLLRLLAGLEAASAGVIACDGKTYTDGQRLLVPPQDRGVGFVFQDGALWPHLDAIDHLRFVSPGLGTAGARALLEQVELDHLAKRRPATMSGGEKQRLALARALAGEPRVLMLDEPLHSVDVHLRDGLSALIRRLVDQRGLGLLLVTHDRDEALSLADRLVVLRDGKIEEAGSAQALLRAPRSTFTATFLGRAACLPAERNGDGRVHTPFGDFSAPAGGTRLVLVLLPGDVGIGEGSDAPRGRVVRVLPRATGSVASVQLGDAVLQVPCTDDTTAGSEVALELRAGPRFLPANQSEAGDRR